MLSLKKNERGFGATEIVPLVFVVVAIGLVGWSVSRGHKASAPAATPASPSAPAVSNNSNAAWRDPGITKEIAAAGQTIVSQQQVTVSAQVDWVNTGLTIAAGQHLWTDTRSDGKWSGNPQLFPYSDAKGLPDYPGGYRIDANANVLSLIGFVGDTPPEVSEQDISIGTPAGGPGGITDPGLFEPGNTLKNYAPAQAGKVWLRNNDNTNISSDAGQQVAKIWVTK